MKFGIDRLLAEPELRKPLEGKRVALVAHPASVTLDLTHSLDALIAAGIKVTAAFGPQHGIKGDKQDNMVETADETDPRYRIPLFSLYGEVRRPTGQMMSAADVFLLGTSPLPAWGLRWVPRPVVAVFGGMGEVQRSAAVVMAVYRVEMYAPGSGVEGATEVLVRKNRNGTTVYVDLYFYKQWLRFEDMLDPVR